MTRAAGDLLRRFLLGSGPLKRRSDRIQVLARLLVVLAFLAAPAVAVAVVGATTSRLEAVADQQEATRHRGHAVLLEDAAPATRGATYSEGTPLVATEVSWAGPADATRTGFVLVPAGTRAGTAVPVWLDDAGSLVAAPLDRTGIAGTALSVSLLPLFGVPGTAWLLYGGLCTALDARRQRRWAEGWAAVEPEWSRAL
jgi:hypothetical protein